MIHVYRHHRNPVRREFFMAGFAQVRGVDMRRTFAAGADTTSLTQRELMSYGSQGAAAEDFSFGPVDLGGTVERIRITARESGVPGTPGTLQVEAVFS